MKIASMEFPEPEDIELKITALVEQRESLRERADEIQKEVNVLLAVQSALNKVKT